MQKRQQRKSKEYVMAAGMKHYLKNGTEHKGSIHKSKGMAMTGATHTKTSKDLFHKKDLSDSVKKRMK